VLIFVIIDDQEIRAIFENHYKDWLRVKGVEAIISANVLPIDAGTKLEKEAIIEVIDKYKNDTLLITHLVGFSETEVFSRDRPRFLTTTTAFTIMHGVMSTGPPYTASGCNSTLKPGYTT
jgi:hypothetical protein